MKRIDLEKSRTITLISIISGGLLSVIGAAIYSFEDRGFGAVIGCTGVFIILGASVFDMIYSKCPYCGEYLDLRVLGDYCPHCGKKIKGNGESSYFDISIEEVPLYGDVIDELIMMSEAWEKENSCRGYRKNG